MTSNVLPIHFAPCQASSSQNSNVDNFLLDCHNPFKISFKIPRTLLIKKKDSFLKWFTFTEQRSCSANQLDVIVDILGVPSDLLNQRDSNKRLFLLKANDKKETVLRRNRPRRSGTCKVKSGLGLAAPHGGAVGLGAEVGGHKGRGPRERPPPLQSGNKSKSCEDQEPQDLLMEVKRRSIYAKDCRLVVY